jgi:hypothetical protein
MASIALHKSSCIHIQFVNVRPYESQWMISSGTSLSACSHRCQTHATVIKIVTKFVEASGPLQTKGFSQKWTALHTSNQRTHPFAIVLQLARNSIIYAYPFPYPSFAARSLCQSQLCFLTSWASWYCLDGAHIWSACLPFKHILHIPSERNQICSRRSAPACTRLATDPLQLP